MTFLLILSYNIYSTRHFWRRVFRKQQARGSSCSGTGTRTFRDETTGPGHGNCLYLQVDIFFQIKFFVKLHFEFLCKV